MERRRGANGDALETERLPTAPAAEQRQADEAANEAAEVSSEISSEFHTTSLDDVQNCLESPPPAAALALVPFEALFEQLDSIPNIIWYFEAVGRHLSLSLSLSLSSLHLSKRTAQPQCSSV